VNDTLTAYGSSCDKFLWLVRVTFFEPNGLVVNHWVVTYNKDTLINKLIAKIDNLTMEGGEEKRKCSALYLLMNIIC